MRRQVSILTATALLVATGIAVVYPSSVASAANKKKKEAKKPTPAVGDPLYSLTLMRQGSTLLQQDQYSEALERFLEADSFAPGNATVKNMIGLCHLQLEQFDQALLAFNAALDLVPSFTDARNNRGAAYLALEQYRLAEVDFLAVLGDSTYPHRWSVYYNLGMTYLRRDQLAAAEDNFTKAVTAPQPVFDAYLRLAEIAQDTNRGEAAVEWLEEARLQYPEQTEATLRLGRLLVELGRPDEARPYLEKVISSEPGSDRAQEASAILAQL